MNDAPLDNVENHDYVLGPRSNPVRLSRKAAVKRSSTKERKAETERHDSKMQSTHVRAKTSSNVPVIRITGSTPPFLRRFSFDETPNELSFNLARLSNSPDFEDVPLSPVAGSEPVKSPQPQLPVQEQRSNGGTGDKLEERMRNQEVEREQRHVPTTFDQILGEKRIPTALL
ncbi:uncharacterized protein J4E87_004738 [Alternaria ethzedia]|uniref:uncharacterized protein n=1 Tax=Alternaria ethzedia TaxID=181014 RepID=UPI0020C2CAFD|nr:uncharacterized protein J4E87_004738 [Alternaria ethzedia]KAI4626238.1 hypothetical protein J4E87_004738 [Alternaria ethzedia]